MKARDEARIRRAVHCAIQYSREHEAGNHLTGIFDLIPFLTHEAELIVKDETARTLVKLVGCN